MKCADNLRDCQEWIKEKLPLSTTSNEAAKLYDAGLQQYVGWFEDERLNGLAGTCQQMLAADPNFIMGKVFTYGLDLIGTGKSIRVDKTFEKQLLDLQNECKINKTVNDRETMHVDAINSFAEGNLHDAAKHWENILVDYPTDMLALKFAHDTYFYLGDAVNVRDSIARVLPSWKNTMPLYGYLKGMLSFGLEETNFFEEAKAAANEALSINKHDTWAVHTLAHVNEMYGMNDEGIKLLKTLEPDWKPCGMLACHLYWHWCLYATENGDYETTLQIFDQEINKRSKSSGAMLDVVDTASILYRLQLEGVNIEHRWNDITEVCRPHLDDHILSFNDAHFMMAFLGSAKPDLVQEMLGSMENYIRDTVCHNSDITKEVGFKICLALVDYSNENYADVVETLYPIRYKIVEIGGSHAQRDVFNQLLIHSCLKSPNKKHNRLARCLLYERKSLKPNSPLTDRLMARLLSCHLD